MRKKNTTVRYMNPEEIRIYENILNIINKPDRDINNTKSTTYLPYSTISFFEISYLRIKWGKKVHFISVPYHLDYLFKVYNVSIDKSIKDDDWARINIDSPEDIYKYSAMINEIYDICYNKTQGDTFHCCSSYLDCSDNKKCIKEDSIWSKACLYRIRLINGIIYYGVNSTLTDI